MFRANWRGPRRVALAAIASVSLLAALGCGGSSSSSNSSGSGGLQVVMADGPRPGVTNFLVNISKVQANVNGTWTDLTLAANQFDLVTLVQNAAPLASTPDDALPEGHYTQIRLFIDSASVSFNNGETYAPVIVPSGAQTGLKINVDFDIQPLAVTQILLDFNVSKSLVIEGNGTYRLQPVIPAVVKVLSGTITGVVKDSQGNTVAGADIETSATPTQTGTTSLVDGSFKIWALMPGTYDLTVTWTDSNNVVHNGSATGLVVNANQNTDAGTITLSP